ncbi:MAG: glycosyl hydrolase 108 family protein, partial [Pseudomonadota bacterium]
MISVDDQILDVLRREGGYVDDPDDPGGATNHGVTIGTMRRLGIDVDCDGDVDKADVRALTRSRAAEIYKREYWQQPKINRLPDALQPSVFDMFINAGGNAVRILQRCLNDLGEDLQVDGAIGSITAAAAHRQAERVGPTLMADIYGVARRIYYYELAIRRPASRK